jgi:hypothetical protein
MDDGVREKIHRERTRNISRRRSYSIGETTATA